VGLMDFLDLSYILLNSLRFFRSSMDGAVMNMNNRGLILILEGRVLKYTEFNLQKGSLKLVFLSVSKPELKGRLYSS